MEEERMPGADLRPWIAGAVVAALTVLVAIAIRVFGIGWFV